MNECEYKYEYEYEHTYEWVLRVLLRWFPAKSDRRTVWILSFLYVSFLRGLLWTLRGSCYCFSCCSCCCSCCSCCCWGIVVSFSQFIQLAQQLLPDKLRLMKLTPDIMRRTRRRGGKGSERRGREERGRHQGQRRTIKRVYIQSSIYSAWITWDFALIMLRANSFCQNEMNFIPLNETQLVRSVLDLNVIML